jgi:hypothetical protein
MTASDVEFAWHVMEPLVVAALAENRGEFSVDFIKHCLQVGTMRMGAVYDGPVVHAMVVTEIAVFPSYRVLRVVLLAGREMDKWKHLEVVLEKYARDNSCAFIEGWTRPGMAKQMREFGYETCYHVIRKPVYERVH